MNYGLKEFDEDEKQTLLCVMKSPFINIEQQKFAKGEEIKNLRVSNFIRTKMLLFVSMRSVWDSLKARK